MLKFRYYDSPDKGNEKLIETKKSQSNTIQSIRKKHVPITTALIFITKSTDELRYDFSNYVIQGELQNS